MDIVGLDNALVTSVQGFGEKEVNGAHIHFMPVASYVYIVGYSTLNLERKIIMDYNYYLFSKSRIPQEFFSDNLFMRVRDIRQWTRQPIICFNANVIAKRSVSSGIPMYCADLAITWTSGQPLDLTII